MKKLVYNLLMIFLLLQIFPLEVIGQEVFKCDQTRFEDSKQEDKIFNDLIMKACSEINSKQYKVAVETLREAIKRDSVISNGVITQYILRQYQKLNNFIKDNEESSAEKESEIKQEDKVKIDDVSSKETTKKPEQKAEQINEPKAEQKKIIEVTKIANEESSETQKIDENSSNQKETIENEAKTADTNTDVKKEEIAAVHDAAASNTNNSIKTFTPDELQDFQSKGINKVKQLESYIQQIANKSTSNSIALASTENAIKLFDSEERKVQVTSLKNPAGLRIKIRNYLNKLRLINYEKVDIKWADFLYTSEFIKGPDGNYYGYITFQQRFVGMVDNMVKYQDVTTKKQQIILKYYEKAIDGASIANWDVFLGDISVEQTSEN